MPSNNFEEKLRQRFEGAKMPPSPDVWPQLAENLAEQNRRDRFLGIFPLWGSASADAMLPHVIGIAAAGVALLFLFWLNQDPKEVPTETLATTEIHIPATYPEVVTLEADPGIKSGNQAQTSETTSHSGTTLSEASGASFSRDKTLAPNIQGSSSIKTLENVPLPANTTATETVKTVTEASTNLPGPVLHTSTSVKKMELGPLNSLSHAFEMPSLHPNASPQELVATIDIPYIDIPYDTNPLLGSLVSFDPLYRKGRTSIGFFGGRHSQARDLSVAITQQGLSNSGVNYTNSTTSFPSNNGSPISMDALSANVGKVNYPSISTGAGVQLEYYLSRNISLQTGLGVNRHIQQSGLNDAEVGRLVSSEPVNEGTNDIRYTDITVPAFINYYLRKGKSALMLSGGLAYQRIVDKQGKVHLQNPQNNSQVAEIADKLNTYLLPTNSFRLAGRAHYQYNISKKFAIHAGPNIGYGLTPVYETSYLSPSRSLSLGWEVGVKFFPGS